MQGAELKIIELVGAKMPLMGALSCFSESLLQTGGQQEDFVVLKWSANTLQQQIGITIARANSFVKMLQ